MKQPTVYILANKINGTIYTGVTSNVANRIKQHKEKQVKGFTEQYDVDVLVWYEHFDTMLSAIEAEKKIKHWNRQWKIDLIEKTNPQWNELDL